MYERDYLMRIVLMYAEIMRRSWFRAREENDPKGAADMLEAALGDATEIDGATLLSLAPESMASILQVSGTDPCVIEYVARSLLLASVYLQEAGESALAGLRLEQARALISAYDLDISTDPEELVLMARDVPGADSADSDDSANEPAIIDIDDVTGPRSEAIWG